VQQAVSDLRKKKEVNQAIIFNLNDMEKFNPNVATFEDGVKRIDLALQQFGLVVADDIITSQDEGINKVLNRLAGDNIPDGFRKWQLPFVFDQSQFFFSVSQPDVKVAKHSHDEGQGIRLIVSGSIYYKDKELKSGDWMYIPKGTAYELTVGSYGVVMFYCYQCCCVPKILNNGPDVINNNPFK
jgi:hypothetical protein